MTKNKVHNINPTFYFPSIMMLNNKLFIGQIQIIK